MKPSLPAVIHFGCGHLGAGAVIPFLIHRYGHDHRIVVVQRNSAKWKEVRDGSVLPIQTTAGDFMPFQTCIVNSAEEFGDERHLDALKTSKRLLILVPSIWECHSLLKHFSRFGSDSLISCSLGEGQGELIQILRISVGWTKALVFENTPARDWKHLDGPSGPRWYPVLVDRICWHVEEFSPKSGRHSLLCHCEVGKHVRFSWPDSAAIPDSSNLALTTPSLGIDLGERIEVGGWSMEAFADTVKEREWQILKKRALVNAPHAIAALLCYRLLALRQMDAEKQYLAPLQEMLKREQPQWHETIDLYLRLRAIEVAWKRPGYSPPENHIEEIHAEFSNAYRIAKNSEMRFFESNDRLDRLMSREKISKEISKFREHIFDPVNFYERDNEIIRKIWRYGRPSHVDLRALRAFLTESFIDAARWLSSPR